MDKYYLFTHYQNKTAIVHQLKLISISLWISKKEEIVKKYDKKYFAFVARCTKLDAKTAL